MSDPVKIGGFETFSYADVSTEHVPMADLLLVEAKKDDLPGLIAAYAEGWFVYIPVDDFAEHQIALEDAGFSRHYVLVITALYLNAIQYARFDADGATHPKLRIFE